MIGAIGKTQDPRGEVITPPAVIEPATPPTPVNPTALSSLPRQIGGRGFDIGGLSGRVSGVGTTTAAGLPTVSDPDKAYADLTRREYEDFVRNFGNFESDTIQYAQNDTSLIDQARQDSVQAAELARGVNQRNLSRYGATLTPMQQRELERTLQRSNTLGGIQSVQDARIAQEEANTKLISDLINIGQGVNRSSQAQLGTSAANATQLNNAYRNARAQSQMQTYSTISQLGTAAIFALAI